MAATLMCLRMVTTAFPTGFPPASTSQRAAAAMVPAPVLPCKSRYQNARSNDRGMALGIATARLPAQASSGRSGDVVGDDHPPAVPPLHSDHDPIPTGRRLCLAVAAGLLASPQLSSTSGEAARAAVLEADDDVELLEKVKRDRKKRLERQGVISSSGRETGYLQALVYKLSRVGQAIESSDLSAAGTILGPDTNAEWVQNVNAAFAKLSSSAEEKTEVDTFNTSLVSLINSVAKKDVESSKLAFVTSATALEKWATMTGLVGELSGL